MLESVSKQYEILPNGNGGFNVSLGGMNPMPGATGGFTSVESAQLAIRVLEFTDGDTPGNGDRFWDLWRRVSGVTQRERIRQRRMAANMGMRIVRVSRHNSRWEQASAAEIVVIKAELDGDPLIARVLAGQSISFDGPLDGPQGQSHLDTVRRLRRVTGKPVHAVFS